MALLGEAHGRILGRGQMSSLSQIFSHRQERKAETTILLSIPLPVVVIDSQIAQPVMHAASISMSCHCPK